MSNDILDFSNNKSNRILTGIEGLDKILNGGFPRGRTILLAGGAGCGKTVFSAQYISNGVKLYDEPGIYVTLGETPKNILNNLSFFDFKITNLVAQKKMAFIDISISGSIRRTADSGEKIDFGILKDMIRPLVDELGAKRLVIDPITAMAINRDDSEIRDRLMEFTLFGTDFGCTTILVSEIPIDQNIVSVFGVEEFVVDGVVILHNMRKGGTRVRGIEIIKMRGTNHGAQIYPIKFDNTGLTVFPDENIMGDE